MECKNVNRMDAVVVRRSVGECSSVLCVVVCCVDSGYLLAVYCVRYSATDY